MVLNQGKSHYMCLGRNTENEIYVLKKKKNEKQWRTENLQKSCYEFMQKRLARNLGFSKTIRVSNWQTKVLNIQLGNKISI